MPGPPPKRSDQRRRRNKTAGEQQVGEATKAPGAAAVEVPSPDDDWHPLAKRWYESLAESGQSAFYEPSDWATAVLIAESISRELKPQGLVYQGEVVSYHTMTVKPGALGAWLKAMTDLMVTEGARRRAAMELQRPQADDGSGAPAPVTSLSSWRQQLG